MKAFRYFSPILFALVVPLVPRAAWALAGEGEGEQLEQDELALELAQQEDGAARLQDVAQKLHGVCGEQEEEEGGEGQAKRAWYRVDDKERQARVEAFTKALVHGLTQELERPLPKRARKQTKAEHDAAVAAAKASKRRALAAMLALNEVERARGLANTVDGAEALIATHAGPDLARAIELAEGLGLVGGDSEGEAEGEDLGSLDMLFQRLEETEVRRDDIEDICAIYCESSKAASMFDVCVFRDDLHLARVAYAADAVTVEQALAHIEAAAADVDQAQDGRGGLPGLIPGPLGSLATAEGATALAIRLATALGKLAIDRAKQEAVIWALGELGSRVCGSGGADTPTTREIRTYWLPQVCTLTSEEQLGSGFGAGQAMFSALISAVESDAKALPGAAAGLVVGFAYWTEDSATSKAVVGDPFECAGMAAPSARCARFKDVRVSTAKAMSGLLQGSDPVDEARTWSTAIDELNRIPLATNGSQAVLVAPLSQLTACGVAVGAELGADDARRTVLDPKGGAVPELYRVIGALTTASACWTLTGSGRPSAGPACEGADGKAVPCHTLAPTLALDRNRGNDIERVSTVIRLGKSLRTTQTKAGDAWKKLAQVAGRLRDARARLSAAVKKTREPQRANDAVLAALGKLDDETLAPEDLRALVDEAKVDEAKERLSSALDVAEELLAATDATAVLLEDVVKPGTLTTLLPGLCVGRGAEGACTPPSWAGTIEGGADTLHAKVEVFRTKLADVQALIDGLREVLAGDWAAGISKALAAVQALFPRHADGGISEAILADGEGAKVLEQVIAELTRRAQSLETSQQDAAKLLRRRVASLEKLRDHRPSSRTSGHKRQRELEAAEYDLRQVIVELAAQASETPSDVLSQQLEVLEALDRRTTTRTVTTELGELVGFLTAILSAKDTDDMAVVLEKTAAPPGGWRRKQAKGAFTMSLGSHVGVYTAAEFRWGQYGVHRERGTPHWQAPTLAVPIGLDFAWGTGRHSVGLFTPLIDPAAFVQYDVSEEGRLPGPRPLTVLSPGAFFRWGICRSPITLLVGYVYRPKLRTWEATINEPGADAHQLGVSLAIDATFWNIVKR